MKYTICSVLDVFEYFKLSTLVRHRLQQNQRSDFIYCFVADLCVSFHSCRDTVYDPSAYMHFIVGISWHPRAFRQTEHSFLQLPGILLSTVNSVWLVQQYGNDRDSSATDVWLIVANWCIRKSCRDQEYFFQWVHYWLWWFNMCVLRLFKLIQLEILYSSG